jgi:sodium-dependent dicarboxylate transporter 2/3/5
LFQESKCAYVIIVMAILWLTEAIPIPVTALIPVFLFPLLGVAKASEISGVYIKVME